MVALSLTIPGPFHVKLYLTSSTLSRQVGVPVELSRLGLGAGVKPSSHPQRGGKVDGGRGPPMVRLLHRYAPTISKRGQEIYTVFSKLISHNNLQPNKSTHSIITHSFYPMVSSHQTGSLWHFLAAPFERASLRIIQWVNKFTHTAITPFLCGTWCQIPHEAMVTPWSTKCQSLED